jgi:hypothetical protein
MESIFDQYLQGDEPRLTSTRLKTKKPGRCTALGSWHERPGKRRDTGRYPAGDFDQFGILGACRRDIAPGAAGEFDWSGQPTKVATSAKPTSSRVSPISAKSAGDPKTPRACARRDAIAQRADAPWFATLRTALSRTEIQSRAGLAVGVRTCVFAAATLRAFMAVILGRIIAAFFEGRRETLQTKISEPVQQFATSQIID